MTNVFLAIPQYKKLRPEEQNRIAKELNMDWWKPSLEGFHPMFDHSVASSFDNPYRIRYSLITRDGNLPRARSLNFGIWRNEYDNPEFKCDYFMIMDDDVSFSPEAIDILVKDNKPIIGGIYTFKSKDPNIVGKCCTRFLNKHDVSDSEPFKVRWINGGFIMIQAKTLFAMIDAYPELMYDVPKGNAHNIEKTWALWTPMVHEAENERFYLDEGWAFCQRAREIGFDIWADLRVKLIHWDAEFGYAIGI